MAQPWRNLWFAHGPLPAAELRRVPPGVLPLDTDEGQAFIGVLPFQLRGLHLRWLPLLPGLSDFPELNVRTYVTIEGKPGVYFSSLDAASSIAVRLSFCAHLLYFKAKVRAVEVSDWIEYRSVRSHCFARNAQLIRYCLYMVSPQQRIYRQEIHHGPWPLLPFARRQDMVAFGSERIALQAEIEKSSESSARKEYRHG